MYASTCFNMIYINWAPHSGNQSFGQEPLGPFQDFPLMFQMHSPWNGWNVVSFVHGTSTNLHHSTSTSLARTNPWKISEALACEAWLPVAAAIVQVSMIYSNGDPNGRKLPVSPESTLSFYLKRPSDLFTMKWTATATSSWRRMKAWCVSIANKWTPNHPEAKQFLQHQQTPLYFKTSAEKQGYIHFGSAHLLDC